MDIVFLELDDVLDLHRQQLDAHGGAAGVRDQSLLQSAVEMPRAGFAGQLFHEFPHEIAAAYLFHLCANHPFIDGNKRTALFSAITFLELNGYVLAADHQQVIDVVLSIASGTLGKAEAGVFFKKYASVESKGSG